MKQILKYCFLAFFGGTVYIFIEFIWRGRSHWTMLIVGGVCFVACGMVNEVLSWDTPLWKQSLICAAAVTVIELVAGIFLNIYLRMGIWDYSSLPGNFLGQICIGYSCLWALLSIPAIVLDDWIRWKFFGEEKPRYK